MKILCINYSITVPNDNVMRLNPDKSKPLSMELVVNDLTNLKTVFFDASKSYCIDKIADERWSMDIEGVWEIRTFDN